MAINTYNDMITVQSIFILVTAYTGCAFVLL